MEDNTSISTKCIYDVLNCNTFHCIFVPIYFIEINGSAMVVLFSFQTVATFELFFENNGEANGRKLTEMEGIIGNKVLKCVLLARIEDLFSKNRV